MGATTSGRVGLAVSRQGLASSGGSTSYAISLCIHAAVSARVARLVSAVSTFTGCHIEISCLIEITSPWCVAWPQGARGVTGAWRAWCRGVLDIGKPPKGGDIVRHGTRKEAIVCWA